MTATASNPLREGMSLRRAVDSAVIVVLGATGDLAGRKLMPALFNLARAGHLPARYAVLGYARRPKSDAEYRADTVAALHEFSRTKPTAEEAEAFLAHVYYQQGNLDDADHFAGLRERIEALEAQLGLSGSRLVYFAISPEHFRCAIDLLHTQRVIEPHREGPMHRIVVEKPFGEDLESARRLNREILSRFVERQVFRIDHYLGKETVQNILAFRFANSIFEPLWTSRHVESVQITVAEDVGMPGRRGQYFDKAGILRDIVQNHALQLLCLVAMEPPASLDAESLRDEKVRLLRAIPVMAPEEVRRHVVRGQYGAGSLMGKAVAGYREEEAVARDSVTETYVALRLQVRNWRWAGVPFLLRSGKRLPKRATEIAVVFKEPPHQIFRDVRIAPIQNTLVIRIQPDEGISLSFDAKRPGLSMELQPVKMDFRYGSSFGSPSPEAYERLLLEALAGDGSLFTRADEIELAWERISAIHDTWNADPPPADFPNYEAGTWGPADAERLVADLSHKWRRL
jgi:glucose-6-phosphate 1-dehydrogenase